jgi:hypothetical protein
MATAPPYPALILIDLQKGILDPKLGPRNNPAAEAHIGTQPTGGIRNGTEREADALALRNRFPTSINGHGSRSPLWCAAPSEFLSVSRKALDAQWRVAV